MSQITKNFIEAIVTASNRVDIGSTPEGYDAQLLCAWARRVGRLLVLVADDVAMARTQAAITFFDQDMECLAFPAWDCLPYDRVSPSPDVLNQRIGVLSRLLEKRAHGQSQIIIATVSAFLQRVVPRSVLEGRYLNINQGDMKSPDEIINFLGCNGYINTDTVMEPGEFARRGGILDIYPADSKMPFRLDFFGDEIESIRTFDEHSQRTTGKAKSLSIIPLGEIYLDDESISKFRSQYREIFSITGDKDPLYESISAGRRYLGMEHWLPLFHDKLETLLDYSGECTLVLANQVNEARDARLDLISEYYNARQAVTGVNLNLGSSPYHPVPIENLYLNADEFEGLIAPLAGGQLSPFDLPSIDSQSIINGGAHTGRDFADIRVKNDGDLFKEVTNHIQELQNNASTRRRVILTTMSEGSRDRLHKVFTEHGLNVSSGVNSWSEASAQNLGICSIVIAAFDRGFVTDDMALITEQDILGERLSRPQGRKIKPENIISDAMTLNQGDLVVHVEHGIGRFDGLHTIEVSGAPHDCLQLSYHGDARLYLPVENIELVSRFGSDDASAQLDRLGGAAWQSRKAKLKERIAEMAEELIKVAAARELNEGVRLAPEPGAFDEFCARFPYTETDDQLRAINAVLEDLASGRNADRLVCGDVGFGKTEIALRAAFVTAMEGKQVAVVVPTTLLCRQHYLNFEERFRGFPIKIRQLSRFVTSKDVKDTKEGLTNGTVDIVIGTHALLAKDIRFRDLGLLVIDEEQHFGVTHKERLKSMKADIHVLTLTATPIPRTLQLALSGVREMSLIATPPVDRLAVRTYILPFDPVVIREAILRERFRGGQTFYVCPRISDIEKVEREIRELVPEVSMVVVHGQMPPAQMEETISSFYEGNHDVLLSTNIIESGIDMPRVNSIIIHRADRFGLSQLYQLRGRVGRSKIRAYAYLTLSPGKKITASAEKRLEVMQTLDHLGAGFSLASHDLDIRGAGNLLGDEQSGHIREVGIELYQQMLEEAVAEARGLDDGASDKNWSPQINLGLPILIPDNYISDLPVRMGLYRRIANLTSRSETDELAAEMIDRFGSLPNEAENLLQCVVIKQYCREAGIEKIDAGPKGAVLSFRNNDFANLAGLVEFIQDNRGTAKLRPDHKMVFKRVWDDEQTRLDGVRVMMKALSATATTE